MTSKRDKLREDTHFRVLRLLEENPEMSQRELAETVGVSVGGTLLDDSDPEGSYVRNLLPPKLALERAYLERASFFSDLTYIVLTARAILAKVLGRDVRFPEADITNALRWAPQVPYPSSRA